MGVETPPLWLLTGERGAGKTTLCRRLADYARAAGWRVAGLLSPAVFQAGLKTGILVEDLVSGQARPLASAVPRPPFDLPLGRWFFDPTVLGWGNRILQDCPPCDLLIVDEIGPLELLRGEGWTAGLAALLRPDLRLGLVVVRPELEGLLRACLPVQETIRLENAGNIEEQARRWWLLLQRAAA